MGGNSHRWRVACIAILVLGATLALDVAGAPKADAHHLPTFGPPTLSGSLSCYDNPPRANYGAMVNECWQPDRDAFVYDPGRGHEITPAMFASPGFVNYYGSNWGRFDKNFMFWAPYGSVNIGGRTWGSCNVNPGWVSAWTHIDDFCHRPHESHAVNLGNTVVTAKTWNGHFIVASCGNPSTDSGFATGPVPRISGRTYADRNRNGLRDGSEPFVGGFTLRLTFNGNPIGSVVSAADGTYAFDLDANGLGQFGEGTYGVERLTRSGWVNTGTGSYGHGFPWAAGTAHNQSGWDFGAWEVPSVAIGDATAVEGTGVGGQLQFPVTLDRTTGVPITVTVSTTNGTAVAPGDFAAQSGASVTIPANTTSGTAVVNVVGDALDEGNEGLTASIVTRSFDIPVTDGTGAGSILDDDTSTLSVTDATVVEGDPGDTRLLRYDVALSTPADRPLTFAYVVDPGTAAASVDYVPITGTITIPAFTTTGFIEVEVIEDLIDELDETNALHVSRIDDGAIGDGDATGTIVDDDTAGVSVADATIVEGDPGDDVHLVHDVTLSTPADRDLHIGYELVGGTATADGDVVAVTGTLTIPAFETTGIIDVPVIEDLLDELDETYTLRLTSTDIGQVVDGEATGTVVDDDTAGVSITDVTVTEGNPGDDVHLVHDVTLSTPADRDLHVPFALEGVTAAAGGDVDAVTGTLTIPAFATAGIIDVPVIEDLLDELDETYVLRLDTPDIGELVDADGLGTVIDDDTARVTIGPATVVEGNPGDDVRLVHPVTLTTQSDRPVSVAYATTGLTAASNVDYSATTGTLTLPQFVTAGNVEVPVLEDLLVEPDETYRIDLSGFVNTELNGSNAGSAIGTIQDDDWRQGVMSCRAQGLRLLTQDLYVANPPDSPCAPQVAKLAKVVAGNTVTGQLRADAVLAETTQSFTLPGPVAPANGDQARAYARLAGVRLTLGLLLDLRADVLESEAKVTCVGGVPMLSALSRVAGVRVLGRTINTSAPTTINIVGLGTLRLNSIVWGADRVTARAIWLDLPGDLLDIVVSEATADIHEAPCIAGRPRTYEP